MLKKNTTLHGTSQRGRRSSRPAPPGSGEAWGEAPSRFPSRNFPPQPNSRPAEAADRPQAGRRRPVPVPFPRPEAGSLPGPGAHQVGVGALQSHGPRVAAQHPHHPRREPLDARQQRRHLGSGSSTPPTPKPPLPGSAPLTPKAEGGKAEAAVPPPFRPELRRSGGGAARLPPSGRRLLARRSASGNERCGNSAGWRRGAGLCHRATASARGPGAQTGRTLKHRGFPLNVRKRFFSVRVTERWHRLLREVVESPSVEILKSCLETVLGNQLWVALLEQGGWTRCSQRSLPTSAVLWFCEILSLSSKYWYCVSKQHSF